MENINEVQWIRSCAEAEDCTPADFARAWVAELRSLRSEKTGYLNVVRRRATPEPMSPIERMAIDGFGGIAMVPVGKWGLWDIRAFSAACMTWMLYQLCMRENLDITIGII